VTANPTVPIGLNNNGHLAGPAALNITGPGTFTISQDTAAHGTNSYSGGTYVNNALLSLGDGEINVVHPNNAGLMGGILGSIGGTLFMTNAGLVETGRDANQNDSGNFGWNVNLVGTNNWYGANINRSGEFRGSGTLNFTPRANRSEVSGNWANFTGVLNLLDNDLDTARVNPFNTTTGAIGNNFRIANANGLPNAKVFLNTVMLTAVGVAADRNGGSFLPDDTSVPIGELHGDQFSGLGGDSNTARVNWQIGGLNTNSTFFGVVSDASQGSTSIEKVGTGILVLANGTNSFTGKATVTSGILIAGDAGAFHNAHLTVNGGTFDMAANNVVLGGISGTGGSVSNNGGGTPTLDINTRSSDAAYSGVIKNGIGEK